VSPVKYELGLYIQEDGILHSHRRDTSNLTLISLIQQNAKAHHNVRLVTKILRNVTKLTCQVISR
jgi:arginine/lysine/ornithine decarboxylase